MILLPTHIAAVFAQDGDEITLYINGSSVESNTDGFGLSDFNLTETQIGNNHSQLYYATDGSGIVSRNAGLTQYYGFIDDLRIYSDALSASEVSTLATQMQTE